MTDIMLTSKGLLPWPIKQGKVRDVYIIDESRLLLVATDRISAFDWVLPDGIPNKGEILNQLSLWWFKQLGVPNHLTGESVDELLTQHAVDPTPFRGRSVIVKRVKIVPFECVVRGYLVGSGWKDYQRTGMVCGHALPTGLKECARLPEPIFTPATKAETGHDENVSREVMRNAVGSELTSKLEQLSLDIYQRASSIAEERGIILADTKFEFGIEANSVGTVGEQLANGNIILADEVLTPDSSRYWPADQYQPGKSQPSFDKQFVRDWLESIGFDKQSPPPHMPSDVIAKTRAKYVEAYERLTGTKFQPVN